MLWKMDFVSLSYVSKGHFWKGKLKTRKLIEFNHVIDGKDGLGGIHEKVCIHVHIKCMIVVNDAYRQRERIGLRKHSKNEGCCN